MASVFDFAAHIRARLGGRVDRVRLLKLVYYVQAWAMADRGQPAYREKIEAWVDGPVARDLWVDLNHNEGRRLAIATALAADDVALTDRVLFRYGNMSGPDLINLTHAEDPWIEARGDLPPSAKSRNEVSLDTMRAYYAQLKHDADELDEARSAPRVFSGTMDELERFLA